MTIGLAVLWALFVVWTLVAAIIATIGEVGAWVLHRRNVRRRRGA